MTNVTNVKCNFFRGMFASYAYSYDRLMLSFKTLHWLYHPAQLYKNGSKTVLLLLLPLILFRYKWKPITQCLDMTVSNRHTEKGQGFLSNGVRRWAIDKVYKREPQIVVGY